MWQSVCCVMAQTLIMLYVLDVCVWVEKGGGVFRFFTTVMAGTLSAARNESKFAQMTMTQTVQQESRVTI